MIDIAAIDAYLSEHGQFCLVDWLLSEGHIAYANYEAWRYGVLPFLTDACSLDTTQLQRLAQTALKACQSLKLQQQPQDYYSWGSAPTLIAICEQRELHTSLAARYHARRDIPQLDLFMDNSAAIAENQLLDALGNRQIENAQSALNRLSTLNAQHPKLGGYQNLVIYAQHCTHTPDSVEDALEAEWQGLLHEVVPQAKELLGNKSRDYLALAWRRLAAARQLLPTEHLAPALHASFAYAQIPDWVAAIQSLENEPRVFTEPELSVRLAEAFWQQRQLNAFYLIWGLLFDRHSELAETLLNKKHRPLIEAWDNFLAFDDDWLPQEFLGYLFISHPNLITLLDQLPVFHLAAIVQPANQAVAALLRARNTGSDEKQAREHLKNASPIMLRYLLMRRD